MLSRADRDVLIGGAVLSVGVFALMLAFFIGDHVRHDSAGYDVLARFNRADGIFVGSSVRLSGAPVGTVTAQRLDDRYRAILTLSLFHDIRLPADSAAVILTDGLLGSKYVELRPGGDEVALKPGQEVEYTQDAVVIEDLLEMIIQQGRAKRGYLDKPLPAMTN